MARGEVKEAIGQGSSPMREALCPRLKALCEVVLAARRCLERQWRGRASYFGTSLFGARGLFFVLCSPARDDDVSGPSS